MPFPLFRVFVLLLLIGGFADLALAQPGGRFGSASAEKDEGWGTFGVGLASDDQVAVAISGNFGRERFVQVGIHGSVDSNLFGHRELVAHHVGVGVSDVGRWHRTAVAAGPALVSGVRRVDGSWDRFFTGGVVVSAQAFFTPIRELGVGLDLFAHVNPVESGLGLTLSFILEANK